jgi:hypothetical protein
MTPQERRLVDDLFARLSELERAPREPDAAAAINEGLQRAPNAIYALVQTVLLQEEALKRAHERLQEYEGGEPQQPEQRGFLDSMRDQFFGGGAPQRGSVPSVGRGGAWNAPQGAFQQGGMQQPMAAQQQGGGFGGGGSFLGTAAAAAAGVIGGSMLMNSISSMMGGGKAFASESGGAEKSSPWSDSSNSGLSKDAGANDVGNNRQGLFDDQNNIDNDSDFGDDFDGDMGSGDGDF